MTVSRDGTAGPGGRLQQLNAVHLNRLYGYLLASGRKDGRGGLSTRSVRYLHTIIRKALDDGLRWGRVERNAADLADPTRHEGQPQVRTWSRSAAPVPASRRR